MTAHERITILLLLAVLLAGWTVGYQQAIADRDRRRRRRRRGAA